MNFPFDEVWQRVQKATGWTKQEELSQYLDISQPSISKAKKRGLFPNDWVIKIGIEFNIDITWLLLGKEKFIPTDQNIPYMHNYRLSTDQKETLRTVIIMVESTLQRKRAQISPDEKADKILKLFEDIQIIGSIKEGVPEKT